MSYVNCVVQEMCSLGLQPLFNGDSETVDIVRFINNAYILVKEQQATCKQQLDQSEMWVALLNGIVCSNMRYVLICNGCASCT